MEIQHSLCMIVALPLNDLLIESALIAIQEKYISLAVPLEKIAKQIHIDLF